MGDTNGSVCSVLSRYVFIIKYRLLGVECKLWYLVNWRFVAYSSRRTRDSAVGFNFIHQRYTLCEVYNGVALLLSLISSCCSLELVNFLWYGSYIRGCLKFLLACPNFGISKFVNFLWVVSYILWCVWPKACTPYRILILPNLWKLG